MPKIQNPKFSKTTQILGRLRSKSPITQNVPGIQL
jgi:hypothetical protein